MAARAALGRAVLATAGTVVALGGATMVVSSVSMGVAKMVITHQKVCIILQQAGYVAYAQMASCCRL